MKFPSALQSGRLIRRYKRFLADIALDPSEGAAVETITAHCANPGSMMGVAPEGARVWVSRSASKTRKLPYSWELVEVDGGLVAINTSNPNAIATEAIAAGRIPALSGYSSLARERPYGTSSRIDILLEDSSAGRSCFVEVKNVHLMRQRGLAEFPDCVTTRGAKHLAELTNIVASGSRAVMLFIVQRSDCDRLSPARDLDPAYAAALEAAASSGVELLCYDCQVSLDGVSLRHQLPIVL